jgi:hypothetical protein
MGEQQGLTAAKLAKEFGVTQADVHVWYCRGWIRSIGKRGAALKFNVRDCVERLMQRSIVDSRLVLPEVVRDMAVMMGVDQPDEGLRRWPNTSTVGIAESCYTMGGVIQEK